MVNAVERELGAITILVNNAGIARPQIREEITEEDWNQVMDINLKSVFLVTQAVLPSMRSRKWGRIINMSSAASQLGGIIGPHYAASKAGILGLTHFYASLLTGEGITVNAIAPALIETEMIAGNPQARPERIPIGRFGTPEEVAEVVVMLTRNGYITGQTINVNGGLYMKLDIMVDSLTSGIAGSRRYEPAQKPPGLRRALRSPFSPGRLLRWPAR